ncbi:MAG: twin-arginine translocase TatA/TatE family subunit [Bacteroidales bacterium]|nr:twin-arginine translocase TatA/TatE family subunit [Bacteroidales bacterium]
MILFISGGEVIFIVLAILLLFGADKLPEIARMAGKGIRQFKDAAEDIKNEVSKEENEVVDDLKEIKKTADDIKKNVKKYKIFENND